MNIVCLDMEGVLVPEIWIAFSEASGIPELRRTTRDEPDYDKLMDESKSLTGDDRLAKMQEAEKVLVGDDAGIAPTFFQTRSWVTQDNVKGIVRHGIGLRTDYKWAYIA